MLALADAPACRLRLGVCQPRLRRPAMLDDGAPQDQDVDARIIARGERIARQAGSGGRAPTFGASSPRLDPRQAPDLQLGHDARCDLVIEACTVQLGSTHAGTQVTNAQL